MSIKDIIPWTNNNAGFDTYIILFITIIVGWVSGFFKWLFYFFFSKNKNVIPKNKIMSQNSGDNCENYQGETITIKKSSHNGSKIR